MKKQILVFLVLAAFSAFGQSGIFNPFGLREISRFRLAQKIDWDEVSGFTFPTNSSSALSGGISVNNNLIELCINTEQTRSSVNSDYSGWIFRMDCRVGVDSFYLLQNPAHSEEVPIQLLTVSPIGVSGPGIADFQSFSADGVPGLTDDLYLGTNVLHVSGGLITGVN